MKHAMFRFLMRLYRVLFARKCFYSCNKFLFNVSLRGIGILNDEDGNCTYTGERIFLRRIASTWGTSATIFDVGANTGEYSRMIMQLAPRACVYAFEPHPRTFAELQRQSGIDGYTALNLGCGDRRGTVPIYDYEGHDGSPHASIYQGVIEELHKGRAVATTIGVIPLDDFIREQKIAKVHLVKIDAEGHELKVLEGLKNAIAEKTIDVIQFEFNAMNVISRSFFRDFWSLLPNFHFYRLLPDGPVPLREYSPIFCELFAFQNIVAIRKDCERCL